MKSTKSDFAFTLLVVIFFILYFKILALAWNLLIFVNAITDVINFIIVIFVVIPAAYNSAKLFLKVVKKEIIVYLIVGIFAAGFLFSKYNEYREKNLGDLYAYHESSFESLEFEYIGHDPWSANEKQPMEELMEFLSQYQVKKMKDSEWDSNLSGEKGFWAYTRYGKDRLEMVSIFGDRLIFASDGYYKVINGPVDMNWIESFNKEYSQ
ncbi:hypothetical protein [Sporosarcina sp. NPDC096371]|uniref:hypothetical protein n=1 Tax=Sporosarcina sp. NPDC096371 TaxID=3364530 RepID=UPI003830EDFF